MENAFDTLAFAKRLEAVGFTRAQAEALADEQGKLIDERLATKLDIQNIRADVETTRLSLKHDIEVLRQEMKRDIEVLRQEVKRDIEVLRQEVKRDIEVLRQEMILKFDNSLKDTQIRIGAMLFALGGVLVAIRYFG